MIEFKCQRCGKCCGIVPFSKKEYGAIRDFAKKRHIGFVKEDIAGKTFYFPKKAHKQFLKAAEFAKEQNREIDNQIDQITCPFLEYDDQGKSKCIIYDKRPEPCRKFGQGGHRFLVCPNNPLVGD